MKKVTLIVAIIALFVSKQTSAQLSYSSGADTHTETVFQPKGFVPYEFWMDTLFSDEVIKASQFKIGSEIVLVKIGKKATDVIVKNGTVIFKKQESKIVIPAGTPGVVIKIETRSDSILVLEKGETEKTFAGMSDPTRFLWLSFDDQHGGIVIVPFATQPKLHALENNQFSISQALHTSTAGGIYEFEGTKYKNQGDATLFIRTKTKGSLHMKEASGSKAKKGVTVNNK